MIINTIPNLEDFFAVIDKCKGQVHAVSPEGDDIVLNSQISRILLSAIPDEKLRNLHLEIKCDDKEDTMRILQYLIRD